MASPGVGAKSYMQWGRETVWGTAVAATKRVGILRHSIEPKVKQERSKRLTGSYVQNRIYNLVEWCEGQIEMELSYNDHLLFLDCAAGTATFAANGGATSGANPYTHVFTDAKEFHNSLTIQLIEGDIPATKCQRVIGAKVVGYSIKFTAHSLVTVTYDIVGKQLQNNQTPTGALTENASLTVLSGHVNSVITGDGDTGADVIVENFEFAHRNGVKKRERAGGGGYIHEPIRDGDTVATMKFRKEFRTVAAFDDFVGSGTDQNPTIVFSSSPSSLTIQMDTARIVSYKSGVEPEFGIMFIEVECESILTVGPPDFAAKVTVVNAQATITT